jgi:UDP-N-acetylglucosamine:LPS N-acetylglucosamine transferase
MIKNEGYNIEIIQQCIQSQKDTIIDYYKKNNIKNYVFEFDGNVLNLILSSDLAITRCGASTTAELAHTITPFIAVPLPNSIDNHQYLNAKFYEDRGCCRILEQHNFNNENLFNLIMELVKNKNELKIMHENMKKITQNNAYSDIENQIKEIIQK